MNRIVRTNDIWPFSLKLTTIVLCWWGRRSDEHNCANARRTCEMFTAGKWSNEKVLESECSNHQWRPKKQPNRTKMSLRQPTRVRSIVLNSCTEKVVYKVCTVALRLRSFEVRLPWAKNIDQRSTFRHPDVGRLFLYLRLLEESSSTFWIFVSVALIFGSIQGEIVLLLGSDPTSWVRGERFWQVAPPDYSAGLWLCQLMCWNQDCRAVRTEPPEPFTSHEPVVVLFSLSAFGYISNWSSRCFSRITEERRFGIFVQRHNGNPGPSFSCQCSTRQ